MKSKKKRSLVTPHVATPVSLYTNIPVVSVMTTDQKTMLKALPRF